MSEVTVKEKQNICSLCNENPSKYCCPRCEVLYCSLDCYKSDKHIECSESFYRDCVNEELANSQADDESKQKMIDILKRMQQNDDNDADDMIQNEEMDSDDDDEVDLEDRLKDLNLDDADAVWNALTEDERNQFEALLSKGDIGSIMPQWEPWWMNRKEKKLVEDVGNNEKDKDALKACPKLKVVPKLTSLTTVQPSPTIKYNITNVLTSYAFLMRYFNGDLDPVEGTICLLDICANLNSNTNFEEPALAVESVGQKCLQSELIQTDEASLEVMKTDTFHLLRGPSEDNEKYYCKSALSHLHQILTQAKSTAKSKSEPKSVKDKAAFSRKFPEHSKEHLPKLDISVVKRCIKKIEYYLSYIESYSMDFD